MTHGEKMHYKTSIKFREKIIAPNRERHSLSDYCKALKTFYSAQFPDDKETANPLSDHTPSESDQDAFWTAFTEATSAIALEHARSLEEVKAKVSLWRVLAPEYDDDMTPDEALTLSIMNDIETIN